MPINEHNNVRRATTRVIRDGATIATAFEERDSDIIEYEANPYCRCVDCGAVNQWCSMDVWQCHECAERSIALEQARLARANTPAESTIQVDGITRRESPTQPLPPNSSIYPTLRHNTDGTVTHGTRLVTRDGLTGETAYRLDDVGIDFDTNPYLVCTNCDNAELYSTMHEGGWTCASCARDSSDDEEEEDNAYINVHEQDYDTSTVEYQSEDIGKIITSKRVFSAELECYVHSQHNASAIYYSLPTGVGLSGDGSLDNGGIEIQTPKLKGKKGETLVKAVCALLNTNDCTVNKTTGLHIHLDGEGLLPETLTTSNPIALKQLWQFYVAFDEVLLSFLPQSRRSNRYCQRMSRTAKYEQIAKCKSQRDIEKLWYGMSQVGDINRRKSHQKDESRYHGVNIHILLAEKHLEVRFHSGTINATKILEWTALHQRVCDLASAGNLVTSASMVDLPLTAKTKLMFSIIGLPDRAKKYFMRRQEQFMQDVEESEVTAKEN